MKGGGLIPWSGLKSGECVNFPQLIVYFGRWLNRFKYSKNIQSSQLTCSPHRQLDFAFKGTEKENLRQNWFFESN